jgi:hypothetical protein
MAALKIRDILNAANLNDLDAALQAIGLGEALTFIIQHCLPTEMGVVVTANVATLAAQPTKFYQATATAGASTGIKELLIGPITGPKALLPSPGQAVWDGGTKVLFNIADAVTAAMFKYASAAQVVGLLERKLSQQDTQ